MRQSLILTPSPFKDPSSSFTLILGAFFPQKWTVFAILESVWIQHRLPNQDSLQGIQSSEHIHGLGLRTLSSPSDHPLTSDCPLMSDHSFTSDSPLTPGCPLTFDHPALTSNHPLTSSYPNMPSHMIVPSCVIISLHLMDAN